MSIVLPNFNRSVVVRGASAAVVGAPTAKVKLLADSNATGGALSTVQVTLEKGADGARPHRHDRSAEMFYVLGGVERFEYFRQLTRVAQGKEAPESLREVQDLYDTHFLNSPEWEAAHKK
jgi:quercetin dioxygenase-like cupin family protein